MSTYAYHGSGSFKLEEQNTSIPPLYTSKKEFKTQLKELQKEIDALQEKMYAHNKWGMLVIFQAMDAAGKDSTMREVFKRVHPLGTSFYSFKRPSEIELDHDYLWRCMKQLPERGHIRVFNRSYYEEVLVVKVHPEILQNYQKVPAELIDNSVWQKRYEDITNFENYLQNNGIVVLKFFLNVSKEEQGRRLIDRINEPEKNWKFEEGDIKERGFWSKYMEAYQDLISATSTKKSPWHIIPADDKRNMQLLVATTLRDALKSLPMHYPEADEKRQTELQKFITIIKEQNQQ